MKVPSIKRLLKEDLAGKEALPPWVDTLVSVFNQAVDPIVTALTGRLSFADNFSCRVVEQAFKQGLELEVTPGRPGKVSGVIPLGAEAGFLISAFGYTLKQNGKVGITLGFSTASSGSISPAPALTGGQPTQIKATVLILIG